jgi:hypothetical protein
LRNSKVLVQVFVCGLVSYSAQVVAQKVADEVMYQSIDVLTSYLEKDLGELSEVTKKLAIVHYSQSDSLPASAQNYLMKRIENIADTNKSVRVIQCVECTSLRAEAVGDEVFIKKGITDENELRAVLRDLDVKTYGDVNLTHTNRSMRLQISMLDADSTVRWTREYQTPTSSFSESPWQVGGGIEAVNYSDSALGSPGAVRAYVGQRLFGLGAVGLSGAAIQKNKVIPGANVVSAYLDLNHNEFFGSHWRYLQLSYLAELGITDFNAQQQLTESFGVKLKFGQYFTFRTAYRMHQSMAKGDGGSIYDENGQEVMKSGQALPSQMIFGLGIEVL